MRYLPVFENYQRTVPRDLFNESKLLKCIGRLYIASDDGLIPNLTIEDDGEAFEIILTDDGYLVIENLPILIKGERKIFKTIYNSKLNYPLVMEHEEESIEVFDEQGSPTKEFMGVYDSL